jgi:outer membrane immunogenic protein
MKNFAVAVSILALSAMSANAADLPSKIYTKAAPAVVASYNWNGFYVGGEFGGGWFDNQVTNGPNASDGTINFPPGFIHNTVHGSGWLGGGYGGYNYQISQFVFGVDGDYTWANLKGSNLDVGPTGFTDLSTEKVRWIATVTGRAGYALNNWLFFAKAGGAWAGFNGISSTFNTAAANTNNDTNSQTRSGWTAGVGFEWGFAAHWSAKLEYDYVKLSTAYYNNTAVTVAGVVTFPGRSATSDLNLLKAGLAYHF